MHLLKQKKYERIRYKGPGVLLTNIVKYYRFQKTCMILTVES